MVSKFVFALFLLILSTGVVQASKIYKIMGVAPSESIMKPVEAKSLIPFYKNYRQLTPGQQAIYRPLIKGHARITRGGFLSLKAMVNEKGEVDEVSIYLSPAEKLTELAIAVLFNTKLDPAICDGKACKMEYPFEFELRDRKKIINSLDKENFGNNARK